MLAVVQLLNDGQNVNYPAFKSYLKGMLKDLNMDADFDKCKAEAAKVL